MLTATYTLVALSVEQASVRVSLQSLQKVLYNNFAQQRALTPGQVDYACNALRRLYDTCHWRKIEKFLIPAIHRATTEADQLLLELERLNTAAAEAMGEVAERFAGLSIDSADRVSEFCASVDTFCNSLLQRLAREEQELFPVARSVISGEAWFSIANKMLAHEAYVQETKTARPGAAGPGAAPAAVPAKGRLAGQRAARITLTH
jgi:hemerythrin-like domain-containing protein